MGTNIFNNIPLSASEEIFDILLERKGIKIERIVSTGQSTPKGEWYDQKNDEWVILLQGSAGLRYHDNNEIQLMMPGDYACIPAGKKHRVEFTDKNKTTIWLAVHFFQ